MGRWHGLPNERAGATSGNPCHLPENSPTRRQPTTRPQAPHGFHTLSKLRNERQKGDIYPIDVITRIIAPGSDLDRALRE